MNQHLRGGLWTLIAASVLMSSNLALAQNAKIGFVDVGRLLEDSPQAVAARQKLQNEFKPRNSELEAQHQEITRLEKQMEKDADVMSETRQLEVERELQHERRDFLRRRDEIREDLTVRRNEELSKLQQEVDKIVMEVAEEGGYDLILTKAVTLYARSRIDITDRVLTKMNNP